MGLTVMISGKQGAGKTTLANNLSEYFIGKGLSVLQIGFGDKVHQLHDLVLKEAGLPKVKDRGLLQAIGTWARENHGPDFWIKIVKEKIETVKADLTIISDCRFLNEIESLPALKIRLIASTQCRQQRAPVYARDNHCSETELDSYTDFDLIIDTENHDQNETLKLAISKILDHSR